MWREARQWTWWGEWRWRGAAEWRGRWGRGRGRTPLTRSYLRHPLLLIAVIFKSVYSSEHFLLYVTCLYHLSLHELIIIGLNLNCPSVLTSLLGFPAVKVKTSRIHNIPWRFLHNFLAYSNLLDFFLLAELAVSCRPIAPATLLENNSLHGFQSNLVCQSKIAS